MENLMVKLYNHSSLSLFGN